MTASLSEIITQLDDGSDLNDVTAVVIKTVLSDFEDIAATLLFSPIRDSVRRARRTASRKAEDAAFADGTQPGTGDAAGGQEGAQSDGGGSSAWPQEDARQPDPLAALRALASETFWVPGDGLVSWSRATEAEHQTRATWLRGKAGAMVTTAERHELAISAIHAAGVERLSEVPGYELVAV